MSGKDIRDSVAEANREAAAGYNVGGYSFKSKETAEEAKNELNAIKYVSAKTDTRDPKQAYLLYNKLLDKELFRTLVGMEYLKELQHSLYESDAIPNDKIRPIPVKYEMQDMLDGKREATNLKGKIIKLEKSRDRYKDYFIKAMIVNVVLVLVIGAMIAIMGTSKNPTVLDYEKKLQDKYAGWQEELESFEDELKERERALRDK